MLRLGFVLLQLLPAHAVRPLPDDVQQAITNSAALRRNDHVLDVAPPGLVLGQPCAGDDACWVVQKSAARPELLGDGGRSLASRNSLLLFSHYGGSVSARHYENLMSPSVLGAMYTVDPDSFFFACPTPDGKLQAQTATLEFSATRGTFELAGDQGGGRHSYECPVKQLVLVLRRSGVQLALGGVPQAMGKQSFGEPVKQADGSLVWQAVRPQVHEEFRAMITALKPANAPLLISFSNRVKAGSAAAAKMPTYAKPECLPAKMDERRGELKVAQQDESPKGQAKAKKLAESLDKKYNQCARSMAYYLHRGLYGDDGTKRVAGASFEYQVRPTAGKSRFQAIVSNRPEIVRRVGKFMDYVMGAMCGDVATYFALLAQPVHQWMVRNAQGAIDVFVRFEQGQVVAQRQASVDQMMALVYIFLESSQRLHKYFRKVAGGADSKQTAAYGIVLFRSYPRVKATVQALLPDIGWGAIFPDDPEQHLGSFFNAPRHGTDEVAANFELATNSQHVATAAALQISDFGGTVELGWVEQDVTEVCTAAGKDSGHWACIAVAHCRSAVEAALLDSVVEVGVGATMPVLFDYESDVNSMTCTPWRTEAHSLALHVVVTFKETRQATEDSSKLQDGKRQKIGLLHGEARAIQLARIVSGRANGYAVYTGECFCSIDARMQNRVCISRGATHTSILFRCNFIEHLEHHPILNLAMADMSGKDGRDNLETLFNMRYKLIKDDAGYLDLSGADIASVSPAVSASGGLVQMRSGGGSALQPVGVDGEQLPLSEVPALGRGAKLRTTCGSGYLEGVVYTLQCESRGEPLVAQMMADRSGSLVAARVLRRGDGFTQSSAGRCAISVPDSADLPGGRLDAVPPPETPCTVRADVSQGAVVGLQLGGQEVTVTQVLGEQLLTGSGGHVPRGTWSFEITRGWSAPFSLQQLLSAPAIRPSYNEAKRVAIVPSGFDAFRPPLVLDSACAEDERGAGARVEKSPRASSAALGGRWHRSRTALTRSHLRRSPFTGRAKANAKVGCNVCCTADQCSMRSEAEQYNCRPITPEMSQTFGGAGELYHALGVCTALKVEVILGPLQRGLGAFQLAMERAITDFGHPDGTRATVAPGLRTAAAQLEQAATATEAAAPGKGDQKLRAYVEEARQLARELVAVLEAPGGSPVYGTTPAGAGSSTAGAGAADDGDIDLSRGAATVALGDFFPGMCVRDVVLGPGRVLEVGPGVPAQPHSGQVLVEYDDRRPTYGQERPLWRTVEGGLIRAAEGCEADPNAGIRITGGA